MLPNAQTCDDSKTGQVRGHEGGQHGRGRGRHKAQVSPGRIKNTKKWNNYPRLIAATRTRQLASLEVFKLSLTDDQK